MPALMKGYTMTIVHVNHRGTRRPRYFVAVTDGTRDAVYAAATPKWIATKLQRILDAWAEQPCRGGVSDPPTNPQDSRPACRAGQLAGELLPATIRRETTHTPEMVRAGQLLLIAEMVAEAGISKTPYGADRELARVPDLYADANDASVRAGAARERRGGVSDPPDEPSDDSPQHGAGDTASHDTVHDTGESLVDSPQHGTDGAAKP